MATRFEGFINRFSGSQMEDMGYIFNQNDMSFLVMNLGFGLLCIKLPKRFQKPN